MSDCNHCGGARRCECEVENDRQRFIRNAAIVIAVSPMGDDPAIVTILDCWDFARNLWDCRPEDC